MGLGKDRHGTYYAIKKVPAPLQEAVAIVLGNGKARQVWLKRSLGTKTADEANKRAKPLPELSEWGQKHPDEQKISAGTINKQLGGVQAACRWARREHMLPDEWADPFAEMRLEEDGRIISRCGL
jgi:hypothetical protein